jgi:isoleucyl-tRNA synthetase
LQALNTPTNGVDELRYLLLVSQVRVEQGEAPHPWTIQMQLAQGQKCQRCWNYSGQVGHNPDYPDICERCTAALAGHF